MKSTTEAFGSRLLPVELDPVTQGISISSYVRGNAAISIRRRSIPGPPKDHVAARYRLECHSCGLSRFFAVTAARVGKRAIVCARRFAPCSTIASVRAPRAGGRGGLRPRHFKAGPPRALFTRAHRAERALAGLWARSARVARVGPAPPRVGAIPSIPSIPRPPRRVPFEEHAWA